MKDLTPLILLVEDMLKKFFETDQKVGLAIAVTLPPEYNNVHWITNLNRKDGIQLFYDTANKMLDKLN